MNRKTLAIIVGINVILVTTIVTLYFTVWLPSSSGDDGFLTITGLPTEDIKLNITQLESLPNISREYYLQGSETFSANYTGVSVFYLVTQVANYTENINVRVIASDNFAYTLSFDDINQTRDIIIAYKKNGEYMDGKSLDGEGPFRLVIPQRFPGEYNGQFCVKFVVVLEIIVVE
ncbi:MAG: hypothetical protein E3J70_12010 [Candidatus Heimdallarchaeota archaeon]|nr:MAG: hypothetical protein E3J70_12010 [Candidatus Heimdallarchaeota archaeon]